MENNQTVEGEIVWIVVNVFSEHCDLSIQIVHHAIFGQYPILKCTVWLN